MNHNSVGTFVLIKIKVPLIIIIIMFLQFKIFAILFNYVEHCEI